MWLQPAGAAAALAGTNLALLVDELVQFCQADMLGPRRFLLSGLLRRRRGTEAAIAGHATGERFVLLDRAALMPVDVPLKSLGRTLLARAGGSGDGGPAAVVVRADGKAVLSLSPVHLHLGWTGGDIIARWVHRSRSGFGWPDFVDAPLAEAGETCRIEIWLDGALVRTATTVAPAFVYPAADRIADGCGAAVQMWISQLSALVGPGPAAVATLVLPSSGRI